MATPWRETLRSFGNRRLGVMAFLGFSSGLPLMLTTGTLQAWLAESDVSLEVIGLFSLVGLPYALKFLWAPLMDRFVPRWFGRRRGWMILTQVALLAGVGALGLASPERAPLAVALLAFGVAFSSASQDVAIDAYRTDVLRPAERGLGVGLFVSGYRVAMLVSGSLALILADQVGWTVTYSAMAALMAVGIAATLASPEPEDRPAPPASLREAAVLPLRDLLSRRSAWALLALVVAYKLGDAFASSLMTAFLIKGLAFSKTAVGIIYKWVGLGGAIVGGLAGGSLMARWGLLRSLVVFGVLQCVTNLAFVALALAGRHHAGLIAAVALENLAGGMGTAAFVAFLMALCARRYSATQYALLSALGALGRVAVGPLAGVMAPALGWAAFFLVTAAFALPGLALLGRLRDEVAALDGPPTAANE